MKLKSLFYFVIVIVSIILVFINQKYYKRIEIVNGYVKNFSVKRGDDVVAFLQPKEEYRRGVLLIYNSKHKIIDSVICKLHFQQNAVDSQLYRNGYHYKHSIKYNTLKLKSGLYYFGNTVPFLVTEPELKNNITIVLPYANLLARYNSGGKCFFGYASTNNLPTTCISLNRNIEFADYSTRFLNWVDSVYKGKNINVISDLDIENFTNIKNAKLLIIYGSSVFWTYEMRKNFDDYNENKGNVLAMSACIMNNKFRYDRLKQQLIFYPNPNDDPERNVIHRTGPWDDSIFRNPNINSVGCSYEICYKPKELKKSFGGFKIIDSKHPIFSNIGSNIITFNCGLTNSIAIENNDFVDEPKANLENSNFYEKKILAYDFGDYNGLQTIGGIYSMKKKKNGTLLIVIGSDLWCDSINFNKKEVQIITKNCIQILSSTN